MATRAMATPCDSALIGSTSGEIAARDFRTVYQRLEELVTPAEGKPAWRPVVLKVTSHSTKQSHCVR